MKTYLLMIGASAALTLALVCIIAYRMSLPDSAAKSQSAYQLRGIR